VHLTTQNADTTGTAVLGPAREVDDTPAGTALRLDAASQEAVLGYAAIDFFSDKYAIKFGTWNQRPVKKNEVRKLLLSMNTHGFRRFDHANFIGIVMKKDNLAGELTQDP
jgi:hypothetical protein